jgi:DNA-binding transcriptional LysR family regulator
VLSRLGDVESLVADLRSGRSGALSIAYFASAGSAWMPTVVRTLLRDFPQLRLNLTLLDTLPAERAERADVQVIVEQEAYDPESGVQAHHLYDDPYVVVLPRAHPLAARPAIGLAELAPESWVDNDSSHGWCRRNLIRACHAAGFAPPFRVEAHDYHTAIAFVDAGIGITVLPGLAARNLPDGVVSVPVTGPTPHRSIYVLVQSAVEQTPPVQAALATLRACAKISAAASSR